MKKSKKVRDKRLQEISTNRYFQKKYWKTNKISFCHHQSIVANTGICSACWEEKVAFGKFGNTRKTPIRYFTPNLCPECVGLLEQKLGSEFSRSYAP